MLVLAVVLSVSGLAAAPVTDRAGPTPVSGALLRVADTPILTLVPSPASGNAPLLVNVSVTVSGGEAPYNLSLCFGTVDHESSSPDCGTGAAGWNGSTALYFQHLYETPGNFSVTGVATDHDGAGVGSTALIVVTDRSALNATVEERTTSGPAPLSVTFDESVAGGTAPITLQWSFGDGTVGSELPGVPVVHVYESAGTFTPTLTVTDGAGHRTIRTLAPVTVSVTSGSRPGRVRWGVRPGSRSGQRSQARRSRSASSSASSNAAAGGRRGTLCSPNSDGTPSDGRHRSGP